MGLHLCGRTESKTQLTDTGLTGAWNDVMGAAALASVVISLS